MSKTDFSKPTQLTDDDISFGRIKGLLPAYTDIPDEFKRQRNKWVQLVDQWFFAGLDGYRLIPKDGIDKREALRHAGTVMRSWELKHEHKTAGVAYLLSLWFSDYTEPAKA